jgi:IS5 family transposase
MVKSSQKWYDLPQNLAKRNHTFEVEIMKGNSPNQHQLNLFSQPLKDLLNPKHPLYQLGQKIPWDEIEGHFSALYSHTGRPSKAVRLMVSLLILKQLYNLSDETVVERWVENPYFQHFSGEMFFQWQMPVHPTDFVLFRKRIGEEGVKKILQVSINLHGKKTQEKEVVIDTTVQEKNITFPTDTKLYRRIIDHCLKIAKQEDIQLRQSYRRTAKKLLLDQRFRRHPKNHKKALAAQRKLKTISGRLVRELQRKLPDSSMARYEKRIKLFDNVLKQKKDSKDKIYSLHEPEVYCISKGKEHKKYEFGSKASIVVTKKSGIIVGAVHIPENKYDAHTLPETLQQTYELLGQKPKFAICDRGYRGKSMIDETQILTPKPPGKRDTAHQKRRARQRFRRRAGIEPIIGHLKSDFRLMRNFLKGSLGDSINLMLAAAAFNFRKLMRELQYFLLFLQRACQRAFIIKNSFCWLVN